MADPNETPDLSGTNPFQLLAYVLFKVRQSLEEEEPKRAPRWVRVVRAREAQGSADVIGKGVKAAVGGFTAALSFIVELTLDIRELLVQTDAAKALVEVSADLLIAVTSKEFTDGVRALVGEPPGDNPLSGVGAVFEEIKKHLGYIPEPDDIAGVGHELYRLMCIVQRPLPTKLEGGKLVVDETKLPVSEQDHIDIDGTGKLRLFQWAYAGTYTVRGLGPKDNAEGLDHPIVRFGTRRVWQTTADKLPKRSLGVRKRDDYEDTVLDFAYDAGEPVEATRTADLVETHDLLEKLGYVEPAASDKQNFTEVLTRKLRRFQAVNLLPITGRLDNDTINRLLNLDFEGQNLKRARPFDAKDLPEGVDEAQAGPLELTNGDADHPDEEGIEIKTSPAGYTYYVAGTALPAAEAANLKKGKGWISAPDGNAAPGFVALKSRAIKKGQQLKDAANAERYDGGEDSEGEASSGVYYFAARHTEPWKAGRTGAPAADALDKDMPPADTRSRLYQWLAIDHLLAIKPPTHDLVITATTGVRALYKPEGQALVADQGRVGLEVYKADVFTGNGARRDVDKVVDKLYSDWYPKDDEIRASASLVDLRRKSKFQWATRTARRLVIADGSKGVAIVLEGRHQAGYDTAAFFDTVRVRWEFVAK